MGEQIFSQSYRLNKKIAFNAIIKRYFCEHLVKCLIQAAILFALAIYLIFDIVYFNNGMSKFLLVACVLAIGMIFVGPVSQAKMSAARFEDGVDFTFSLFENALVVSRGEVKTEMIFSEIAKALELKDFLYIESNNRFFPIPKSDFENSQLEKIKAVFEKNLEKRYKFINK